MKLIALALIAVMFSVDAFSQSRGRGRGNGRGHAPGRTHRPPPPGHYRAPRYPAPHRRPMPAPGRTYSTTLRCSYGDMYRGARFVHRFSFSQDCRSAIRDAIRYGRFCDYSDMYNMNGRLIARYRSPRSCEYNLR